MQVKQNMTLLLESRYEEHDQIQEWIKSETRQVVPCKRGMG